MFETFIDTNNYFENGLIKNGDEILSGLIQNWPKETSALYTLNHLQNIRKRYLP